MGLKTVPTSRSFGVVGSPDLPGAVGETLEKRLWVRVVAAIHRATNTATIDLPRVFLEARRQWATSQKLWAEVAANHDWQKNFRFDFLECGVRCGDARPCSERIVQQQNALRLQVGGRLVSRCATCAGVLERYVEVTKVRESVDNAPDSISCTCT